MNPASPTQAPKSSSSWKILDILKISSSPKQSVSPSNTSLDLKAQAEKTKNVCKCSCCGAVLTFPEGAHKFSCPHCQTTNLLHLDLGASPPVHLISYKYVKSLIDSALHSDKPIENSHDLHERLKPVSDYLLQAFGSMACLNQSFKLKKQSRRPHYSTANLNYDEIRHLFELLTSLPSRRPLYYALSGACNCLRRLPLNLSDDPRNLSWVLVLFEIPFLSKALTNNDKRSQHRIGSMVDIPEIQALCYEILKRVLGIISQAETTLAGNYVASWFSKRSQVEFMAKVELVNLYITFHLKKYFYFANNPQLARRGSSGGPNHHRRSSSGEFPDRNHRRSSSGIAPEVPVPPTVQTPSPPQNGDAHLVKPTVKVSRSKSLPQAHDEEFFQYSYLKDEVEGMDALFPPVNPQPVSGPGSPRRNSKKKKQDMKVRVHQYSSNYHLRTASGALSILVKANYIRYGENKVPVHAFYNSLVDYVNIKLDYDAWSSRRKSSSQEAGAEPALQTVIDYIHGANHAPFSEAPGTTFYFCQYPFLITLGGKIAILEYEARRQMERKAEEAFINSLDRRVTMDVYFRVKVRRDYIVQDSLRCIQLNPNNLKKSLRVQFINEPGVDAGGLKKEWFLLLTRALFSPHAGMLSYVEDSNLLWFNVVPVDNFEMYYLFGAILGLAIYNSTILDLKFPITMYKILLGLPIGLADYQEIYPMSARNLFRLRDYSAEEIEALDLTFEVCYSDPFGRKYTKDLIAGGSNVNVDKDNRELYIDKYARFFLWDGMHKQLCAFKGGFSNVVDGNAFSLFSPEEIQLLLCGSDESKFDVDVLQSVTNYSGWPSKQEAVDSNTVKWFWEYVSELTYKQQKKLLLFITGSDRVPATGIQNLTLKISRLRTTGGDSDRLPVAHTCFNELALYDYSSKSKLADKLGKAVNMSAGFGIK
ncbi:hypothetical protein FT663_00073 [Candidozyma haemuli var. vulneris]|uniref:HECT-type E3 ubiquitin transferase n=1 Tax=Candidozyma haemuli TaxID=45357 RepID=A0A2V1AUP6_9ASCO|nr:hypothetical protein CXQ85_000862 [[Candida] haemuloni]KAF3994053.1 hypothetical protein FT662_00239 [[Candida] haemuloni var. vulneris]KAF3995850.1 hypothetical protein FT663_00073 [[Candida] haemuloni var. vulneris]PVH21867.1 hypothetical protein CXQ85_000862 [[Candida] haemuloni]